MNNVWSEHLSAQCIGSFRTVCVSAASLANVQESLESQGFRTYILDLVEVDSKASLLSGLVESLEITDYSKNGLSSWDATVDIIWQILMNRPDKRVALLWIHFDVMIARQLQLSLDAIEMLYALADTLERQEATADTHPVLLRIAAFGEGRGFPAWA
jgi:hypothetical protein